MTDGERDERLGRLAEELALAVAAGEPIDAGAWAARYRVTAAEVEACTRALRAFDSCLGEEGVCGPPELPLPTLPDGFVIEGELGRGGMGVVYRATQPALGRTVAVKVLRPGELRFGDALRRFRDEARSLARLRHRHIVSIHDVGETPEGLLWYAMDLVDGRTLAEEIDAIGALTPSRAVRVIGQVTSAIAHAHAQGIVHRDLKPQNVLIDAAGDAYVVDFGLARDASLAGARTVTGELLGTPAYMSPEQASGAHGRVGESTDVWALGALLYEALTGRGPFAGKPLHETIRAILDDEPSSPRKLDPRVPAELAAVCMKALRKKPEQRYPTALAFGEELERFAEGRGVLARNPHLLEKLARATWRHRAVVGVGAAVALVLAILFGVVVVPEELRAARIADAGRAFEAGYAGAAVEPLRELGAALASDDPAWSDFDLLLLQALHARVAELLDARALDAARELLLEARETAARRWRAGQPTDPLHVTLGERSAWEFELLVCRTLAKQAVWRGQDLLAGGHFEVGVLTARFVPAAFEAAWRHPSRGRRLLADAVAWEVEGDPLLGAVDPRIRAEVLTALHRRNGSWLAARVAGDDAEPDRHALGWSAELVRAWWSPDGEDALAALATDPGEDPHVRMLALRTLSTWIGLPSAHYLAVPAVDAATFRALAERRAESAPDIVSRWRSWRSMSREASLRARIDPLVAGLTEDTFGLGPDGIELCRSVAARWSGDAAQARSRDPGQLRAWWAARRDRPVEEWVREDLGIPAERDVDYAAALGAAAVAPVEQALLWRHLAWLRLPAGLRVPELVVCSDDDALTRAWLPAWRRAGGIEVARDFVARIGVLMFRELGAEPELLGEAERELSAGEAVELSWQGPIPISFGPRVFWRSYGDDATAALQLREHPDRVVPPRQVRAVARCELIADDERPYLSVGEHRLDARVPMDGGGSVGRSSSGNVGVGEARAVEFDASHGGSLGATVEFVLLVRLDRADRRPARGDVAAWRSGCALALEQRAASERRRGDSRSGGVEVRAGSGAVDRSAVRIPTDFDLPSRWPMPEAAEALRQLAPGRPLGALLALWNAGVVDETRDRETLARSDARAPVPWARVALTAPTAELRRHGRRLLAAGIGDGDYGPGLSPRAAELLLERRGDELEPELAAKLRARVSAHRSPWLRGRFLAVVALLSASAAGIAFAFSKRAWSGRAAWVAWLCAAMLTCFRVETDAFAGPPLSALLLLAAVAATRMPAIGPRVLAVAVPGALALWSFIAVRGYVAAPPAGAFWSLLLPPYAGVVARLRPDRRRRLRRGGASLGA
ncbi:MAG: protein kinase [Planctomycetes bacterium]|nr:protein kinase [Planctomycetota bacterium]